LAGGALLIAAAALLLALGLLGGSHVINARFENAGQLVVGGEVQIAGRRVGTISDISLSQDGRANVALEIGGSAWPLHQGTWATIRAVGQAGVANRFVTLTPGSASAPELPDGAVLDVEHTTGIVDLDALLNTFDPHTRDDLRGLIRNSSGVFAGSGSRYFNSMLAKLDPALREASNLAGEVAHDKQALSGFVATAAESSRALASRRRDLEEVVVNASHAFGAIASEREPLADVLQGAPGVLGQARHTLGRLSTAVTAVRPTLQEIPPAGGPLRALVRRLTPALRRTGPVAADLRGQLPGLDDSLAGLKTLDGPAVKALDALAPAVERSQPILQALRYYGTDFTLGVTNGLAGILAANYNYAGHYGRLNFVENPQSLMAGIPAAFLDKFPLVPGILATRTGLDAPCPGSGAPPAPDGSNPWVPDPKLCDPSQSTPASVNHP
jgi:phospholipid/cholesterol/gamma-HCH transport system substrate-binding protein